MPSIHTDIDGATLAIPTYGQIRCFADRCVFFRICLSKPRVLNEIGHPAVHFAVILGTVSGIDVCCAVFLRF